MHGFLQSTAGAPAASGIPLAAHAYLEAVLRWDREQAFAVIAAAQEQGASIEEVYLQILAPAQVALGDLLKAKKIAIPQEHFASATTQAVMAAWYQQRPPSGRALATAIIACPSGELHQIGGRMIADLLEHHGWDADYLGSVEASDVVKAAHARRAQLIGLSVSQTGQLRQVQVMISQIREALGPELKILLGGRAVAVDPGAWASAGADLVVSHFNEAVLWLRELASIGSGANR